MRSLVLAAVLGAATACGDAGGGDDGLPADGTSADADASADDDDDGAATGDDAADDAPDSASGSDGDGDGDDDDSPSDDDSGETGDADTGDSGEPSCDPPAPDPAWIEPYETAIVARLSGHEALDDGTALPDRATPQNRATARAYLESELAALGLRPLLHTYANGDGANLYAAIEATVPTEETVVFGAHFDTVPASPGANDNATGVALGLALARWALELPCRQRNLVVVLFDQEEIGLVGSDAFAAFLVEQDIDVLAAHTVDQMGWDADGDRTLEIERADPGLFELYETSAAALDPAVPLTPTDTGFTDHVSFRAHGLPAVGLTEEYVSGDTTPHYHLPSDTFDTVDFDYLRSSTVLVLHTFGELLTADAG